MNDLSFPSFSPGQRVIDVSKFGALGEGADESAAITAALAALPSSGANQGGQLYFPGRFYRFNTGIVSTLNNVEFLGIGGRGQSRGLGGSPSFIGRTCFVIPDGITGLTWGTSGNFSARGPVFRNIHWTAENATAGADTRALLMYGPSNWLIDNCGFSGFNWSIGPATITGISWSAGTATVTTSAAHGFSVGHLVQMLGVVTSPARPNGYNACRKVLTVADSTHFTFSTAAIAGNIDPGTWASGGTAYALGMAVKIGRSSGNDTTGQTAYGNVRDCTFASANGIGGLWIDHCGGIHINNTTFDGNDNGLTIATAGVGLAVTGKGAGVIKSIGSRFQAYQTLIDLSGGGAHEIIGTRLEAFGIGFNVHTPDVSIIGGGGDNGGTGSGGTVLNFGPDATNLRFSPATPLRKTAVGARYTCRDAAAGASFRDNGEEVIGTLAADQAVTASTVLVNATGVVLTIGNSTTEIWYIEGWLMFVGLNTAMDAKLGWNTMPTSATMLWGFTSVPVGAGLPTWAAQANTSSPIALGSQAASPTVGSINGNFGVSFNGYVYGGGTAGDIQLQFAQGTSDAAALTLKAGSFIRARRVQP